MDDKEINNLVDSKISKATAFSTKKLGDTPTDNLQLTPRKYINLNGNIAARPASILAMVGQQYYATDLNKPIFYDGTKWRDATSSVIASN